MKRFVLSVVLIAAGLAVGGTARFDRVATTSYRKGWDNATATFQRDAVNNGHGRWTAGTIGNRFEWIPVHTNYNPDRPADSPFDAALEGKPVTPR